MEWYSLACDHDTYTGTNRTASTSVLLVETRVRRGYESYCRVKCNAPTIMIRDGKEGRAQVVDSGNARSLKLALVKLAKVRGRSETREYLATRNGMRGHKFINYN